MYLICHNAEFDVLEHLVDIDNVYTQILNKIVSTVAFHWDNNLFVG